jgi:hypothetical protein
MNVSFPKDSALYQLWQSAQLQRPLPETENGVARQRAAVGVDAAYSDWKSLRSSGIIAARCLPQKAELRETLNQAQALAQNAYDLVAYTSPPKAIDIIAGQQQLKQAEQLRQSVAGKLTPAQQDQLKQVQSMEQQAFALLTQPDRSLADRGRAQNLMQQASQLYQLIDNALMAC